jgi:hypothetical protein
MNATNDIRLRRAPFDDAHVPLLARYGAHVCGHAVYSSTVHDKRVENTCHGLLDMGTPRFHTTLHVLFTFVLLEAGLLEHVLIPRASAFIVAVSARARMHA